MGLDPSISGGLAAAGIGSLIGREFGPYRVEALVGSGGTGAVYRARDVRLGRPAAIKVLLEPWTNDPERLARLDREARALAALNHPNIATIYGVEEADGIRGLAMEFVEGETLAERIARPPAPGPGEALAIARQIAEALDAAHEKGIVHRDLKPANIKLSPDGAVKVLDFGLARLTAPPAADLLASGTTQAVAATAEGAILGTLAYMSPEQARGEQADKRADIWAFGCVVYELLTGRRAFPGSSAADIVAAILTTEPDWSAVPASTPVPVRRLLARCLEKDPKRRLRDIGNVPIDLDDAVRPAVQDAPPHAPRWRFVLMASFLVVAGGAAAWFLRLGASDAPVPTRFLIDLDVGAPDASVTAFEVSPDGRYLVFEVMSPDRGELRIRELSEPTARTLAAVPSGLSADPFFSPDSRWIGFFAEGKLKKISIDGGAPLLLADAPSPRGGAWGDDGTIVFAPLARSGLRRVSADGGAVQTLTTPDPARGETSHANPTFLPAAAGVVFSARGSTDEQQTVAAVPTDGGQHLTLLDGSQPGFARTGHLLFQQEGTLLAVPFDPASLSVRGGPTAVLDDVRTFTTSTTGTLFYRNSRAAGSNTVLWVDRRGSSETLPFPPGDYIRPRLSPDGNRIAVNTGRSIAIFDRRSGGFTRLSSEGSVGWPAWTPDGSRLIYASIRPGTSWDLAWRPADGSGHEELLLLDEEIQHPGAISPDGTTVAYQEVGPRGWDISMLSIGRPESARVFQGTAAREESPYFSPDGRWLAFVSDVSGRKEVYVRPVAGEGMWQVSTGGGTEPVWSGRKEIFYRNGPQMLSVEISTAPGFTVGRTQVLFEGAYVSERFGAPGYDVTRDGQRFLMIRNDSAPMTRLNVIVNWDADLVDRLSR
jgi:serine/threonine-protein kinase